MSMKSNTSATRQIGQAGDVLGEDNVTPSQNLTGREDTILSFTCPRKFKSLYLNGNRHDSQSVLRYMDEGSVADATLESDRTFTLSDDILQVAGESDIVDQPFPAVVVQNVTQDAEITPSEFDLDYSANTVHVHESAVATGDNIKLYPVITSGGLKYSGIDRFDNKVGSVQTFEFPIDEFVTHNQKKGNTRIRMGGEIAWDTGEEVQLLIDSPVQVVWTDADYPQGSFVSSFNQRVAASTV